ncbi:LptF/LptG family permease [Halonatronum saccharophilum]|uniref:LptF/LptG family permease n=1 Tax=Halonatronum saccharophilum TaxID=150060 RepID=UPI0004839FE9|nr:LptF/LptG family permease [Halonatronum saccharophilum]
MKIVNRYILVELLQPFLFGVFAFTSIFVGSDILIRLAKMMTRYNIPLLETVKLFFLSLPQIIVFTFPMAMLLATLLAFGRLSGDSEIVALRASGVSFTKLIVPVLIIGLLISGLTVLFNDTLVPISNNVYEEMVWRIRHGEVMPQTQRNLQISSVDRRTGSFESLLIANKFDGDTQELEGVIWQEYEDGRVVNIIEARQAKWVGDQWVFIDGIIYNITSDGRVPRLSFEEYNMEDKLNRTPRQISRNQKDPDEMTLNELRGHIRLLEEEGRDVNELKVLYHQRYAIPFASFIFALLGAPLGLKPNRSGSSIGLGFSIIVIFIYYTLMTVGASLGEAGHIAAWIGAWIQNIVFGLVGIGLLFKVSR